MDPKSKFGNEQFLQIPMRSKPLFIPLHELTKNIFIMPFRHSYHQLMNLLKKWLNENKTCSQGDLVGMIKTLIPPGSKEFDESVVYPKFDFSEVNPEMQQLMDDNEAFVKGGLSGKSNGARSL